MVIQIWNFRKVCFTPCKAISTIRRHDVSFVAFSLTSLVFRSNLKQMLVLVQDVFMLMLYSLAKYLWQAAMHLTTVWCIHLAG